MDDHNLNDRYIKALEDFHRIRKAAALQHLIARISKSVDLLPFGGITHKLRAKACPEGCLENVPVDRIIASISRYRDYFQSFFPPGERESKHWLGLKMEMNVPGRHGLAPVDLYQVGNVYLAKGGHHRITAARRLHKKSIPVCIIEKFPLSHDTDIGKIRELILEHEYAAFLKHTQLHQHFPDADFRFTFPGLSLTLEEHIKVHRYYMGIDALDEPTYDQAVMHWYKEIYLPIRDMIRELAILHLYPVRTETDLYVWVSDHLALLQAEMDRLVESRQPIHNPRHAINRLIQEVPNHLGAGLVDLIYPVERAIPRIEGNGSRDDRRDGYLFNDILVPVDDTRGSWPGLEQALLIAGREKSRILGLHIVGRKSGFDTNRSQAIREKFVKYCTNQAVKGDLAIQKGEPAKLVIKKALHSDLVALNLGHPQADSSTVRFTPGLVDIVRHSGQCILATPGVVTPMNRILLAYNNSRTSREALFICAYFVIRWGAMLGVVSVCSTPAVAHKQQMPARAYLKKHQVPANFYQIGGYISEGILKTAGEHRADLVVIGGFNRPPMVEVVLDMTLDQILRTTKVPVLICQ